MSLGTGGTAINRGNPARHRNESGFDVEMNAAEAEWLEKWAAGPTGARSSLMTPGTSAPNLSLPDETGLERHLAEFWADGPALIMFWRHFGCSCGVARADRLASEYDSYREGHLTPVIIAQGEPDIDARYKADHEIPCPVLSDPRHVAYEAYGVRQWAVEQVLFDAPPEYWTHSHELGAAFQEERRQQGRVPVNDPWRATAEFVVGSSGVIRLAYDYQHCEDYPDPRVLITAGLLS